MLLAEVEVADIGVAVVPLKPHHALERVARVVARHADIRATTIYTAVNPSRLEEAVAERARQRCRQTRDVS